MSYEGAMLGGYLLPEKEFKEALAVIIKNDKNRFILALRDILHFIELKEIRIAYQKWDYFQTEILKNPTVDLLAITNWYNSKGKPQQWIFTKEINALHKGGQIDITKIKDEMKKTYYSKILTQHLSNLFKTLNESELSYEEQLEIYENQRFSDVKSRLSIAKANGKDYRYGPIIYGQGAKNNGVSFRGKAADAFVNHLGKIHQEIFISQNLNTTSLEPEHSVKAEEDMMRRFGFLHLLLASLNNTGWWTGGDLIITSPTGKILANIQLKTSAGLGENIGQIKTKTLSVLIQDLINKLLLNDDTVIDNFYEALKTSSVSEELGDAVIEDLEQLAIENILGK